MTAFALCLLVFAVWSLLGWPLVCSLNGGRNLIRNALLAPIAGTAALLVIIFECYRWGLPVHACGPVATAVCLLAAAAGIWKFRFPVPWRRLTAFLLTLTAAVLLIGYPMLLNGFDWISYANNDMAIYVLRASAFLDHGFLNAFDPKLILEGRDMTLADWISVILTGERCGGELMLAWVMSLTGLSGHQVFMPVMVALHLDLICATAALVMTGRKHRLAALAVCGWMGICSLVTLGTVYQLIGQVFGLGLLAGAATLLLEPAVWQPRRPAVKRCVLAAIFGAAICVAYPEILPFLALAFVLAHVVAIGRRRENLPSLTRTMALTSLAAIALLNNYADCVPLFLRRQAEHSVARSADLLFPYYLVPSGLATFWGFLPIAASMSQPLLDMAIAVGTILLALAAFSALWQWWRGHSVGSVAVVMLGVAAWLFYGKLGFGVYKAAMYCQPFIIGSLVMTWFNVVDGKGGMGSLLRKLTFLAPIAAVAAAGLHTQSQYVGISSGREGLRGGFVEVPEASSRRIISHVQKLSAGPHRSLVVSDAGNIVLANIEANYFRPVRQEYAAQDYFTSPGWQTMQVTRWFADLTRPGYVANVQANLVRWNEMQLRCTFDMHDGRSDPFVQVKPGRESASCRYSLLTSGSELSILNRREGSDVKGRSSIAIVPSEDIRNHLIPINSDLGRNYYNTVSGSGKGSEAFYQLEPDYFYPDHTMSGVGRVLLFEVLNPTREMRLAVEYTASLQADGVNEIPRLQAVGAARYAFDAVGRGSARLFSPPLEQETIAGHHYVALDMGAAGRTFPIQRAGLMRWFGTSVALDSRRLNGFMRDISMISGADYASLRTPTRLAHFPADLAQKGVEYSGIYEDGWVGEKSIVCLRQPAQQSTLVVRAIVPTLTPQPHRWRVLADGATIAEASVKPGENEVQAVLNQSPGRKRIELEFDHAAALPAPDNRPVSARIEFIGFADEDRGWHEIAEPPIHIGEHWYPFETFHGATFRWVDNHADFDITLPGRQSGDLAIDIEPGPGMQGKPTALLFVLPDGRTQQLPVIAGRQNLQVPVTLNAGVSHFTLECTGGGFLIPTDPRRLNFRVFRVAWTPRL